MPEAGRQRIDKWLWFARLTKTRTLAQKTVVGGRVRVNREKVNTSSHLVAPGDVLTIAGERGVRVVKVLACGTRRGPASEAQALYQDLSVAPPPGPLRVPPAASRPPGSGRPTKRDRRALDSFRDAASDDFPVKDD
jgi:ribosome-associated heat shock protein Hsp15